MSGDLLQTSNLHLSAAARTDLASGQVAPQLVGILRLLLADHEICVRLIKTGHPMGPISPAGRRNDHYFFRAFDVAAVDSIDVEADPVAPGLIQVGQCLMALDAGSRAARVMGPAAWHRALGPGDRSGFRDTDFANRIHADHLHIGVGE